MAWVIDRRKITHYLLTSPNPKAAGKNAFFRSIGFSVEAWDRLHDALIAHPAMASLAAIHPMTAYGIKHVYCCRMPPAPNGRAYCIRSVWMQRAPDCFFVTAYPQPER